MKGRIGLDILFLQLCKAILADTLVTEEGDIIRIAAKDAGGVILLQNDLFLVYKDLQGILGAEIQAVTQLDGEYDSAKLINFSYNSG
jgi:hypothetical protein